MKNLHIFQEQDDDDSGLTILNLISTQWLSLSNVVTIYIVDYSDFIIATKFLADILYIFKFLMLVFQKDYITLSDIHYILELTINAINVDFVGIDNVPPTYGNHLLNICKKII